jgi:DNA-binding transcriptional regulator YdaS (Cro superfamily)
MRSLTLLVAALLSLAPVAARAGEPSVEVASDGSVVARVQLPASEAEVRALIPSLQAAGVNSNVLDVVQTPEGGCTAIHRTTRGLYRPLQLRTRFCPSASGWTERLVQSADFTAYEADWTLRPLSDGGTQVQLRVRSDINLMVPASLLQTGTMQGVRETIDALIRKIRR